jgi:hypothetical protein
MKRTLAHFFASSQIDEQGIAGKIERNFRLRKSKGFGQRDFHGF